MRLLIDLQAYQSGAAPHALQPALALATRPGPHEVWLLVGGQFAGSIDSIRQAFDGVVARERIVTFALPARLHKAASGWRREAAEQLRQHCIAGVAPDLVLLPEPMAHTACVLPPAAGATPTVFALSRMPLLRPAQLAVLTRGMQLLVANDKDRKRIAKALGDKAPPLACVTGHEALWPALEACVPAAASAPAPPATRPRLAYVSPLPPVQSGIADYSAALVPALAQWYEIDLVVDQPQVDDARLAGFPVRDADWFDAHADEFDRIVYHFGNAPMHRHQFGLLERHPGVVVLHDFYLGNVIDYLDHDGYLPQGHLGALLDSHGYGALQEVARDGRNAAVWKYPANKQVLDQASGVIVHSAYARTLAEHWYGPGSAHDWQVVPMVRALSGPSGPDARARARAALGIGEDEFVLCSFGMLGRTKLNRELVDAFVASPLCAEARCRLVFVGGNEADSYGQALLQAIDGCAARVSVTGFVDAAQYASWLHACDGAVQLRSQSRGETSAAILDCMLYGVPTIINAHGAGAELPRDALLVLDDDFGAPALAAALQRLYGDDTLRASLSAKASAYIAAHHAPAQAGAALAGAIEQAARGPGGAYQRLLSALAPCLDNASSGELSALAGAIAANRAPLAPRQLLIDISALVQTDLRTGIQRVVRSELLALLAAPPAGYRIEPVYSVGGNTCYRYARRFMLELIGAGPLEREDAPVEARRGDVFLGLDLLISASHQNLPQFEAMRAQGVAIYFVVYDVLPLLQPQYFPYGTEQHFSVYLRTIATISDGLACISRSVADELAEWLAQAGVRRSAPLRISYFHLGADIAASAPTTGLPDDGAHTLEAVAAHPSVLMVGTVEPRKGHAQTLSAFELLWRQGLEINLVIVGKQGWMVDEISARLAEHPQRGKHLFWLQGVSDEMLELLYGACTVLLAASEGEGFGLPLIEASQHGIPIIARGLPVFREVAGEHAYYFDGLGAPELAEAVRQWLALQDQGGAPGSSGIPSLNWAQSATELVEATLGRRSHVVLPAPP